MNHIYYIIYIYINNVFTYLTIVIIPHQHILISIDHINGSISWGRLWPPHLARQWQTACGSGAQRGAWRMVPSSNGGENLLLSISINVCGMNIYLPSILRSYAPGFWLIAIYTYTFAYIYIYAWSFQRAINWNGVFFNEVYTWVYNKTGILPQNDHVHCFSIGYWYLLWHMNGKNDM